MNNNIIPIDFVAGTHGHFLEVILNTFTGVTERFNFFTSNGTSHVTNSSYLQNRLFQAEHWFELFPDRIKTVPKLISIQFTQDDLLLVSSVSLLRAGDFKIDNNDLENNTYNKLNTIYYKDTLNRILKSYPVLVVDEKNSSIPRNILREFYKFGFAKPDINGYWLNQQKMKYSSNTEVFYFDFANFYNIDKFLDTIRKLEIFINKKITLDDDFLKIHSEFLSKIPYINHKEQCDSIIQSVVNHNNINIPSLTLLQESYINGCLENIFKKEMPFHDLNYFTSTKDMLHYILTEAPNI